MTVRNAHRGGASGGGGSSSDNSSNAPANVTSSSTPPSTPVHTVTFSSAPPMSSTYESYDLDENGNEIDDDDDDDGIYDRPSEDIWIPPMKAIVDKCKPTSSGEGAFRIVCTSTYADDSWTVGKTYSDFCALKAAIEIDFPDTNQIDFPQAEFSITYFLSDEALERRRGGLSSYLSALLQRRDLISQPRTFKKITDFLDPSKGDTTF